DTLLIFTPARITPGIPRLLFSVRTTKRLPSIRCPTKTLSDQPLTRCGTTTAGECLPIRRTTIQPLSQVTILSKQSPLKPGQLIGPPYAIHGVGGLFCCPDLGNEPNPIQLEGISKMRPYIVEHHVTTYVPVTSEDSGDVTYVLDDTKTKTRIVGFDRLRDVLDYA